MMLIPASSAGIRLDQAIADALRSVGHVVSAREVRRALEEGMILVEGRSRRPGDRARGGERFDAAGFTPRLEAALAPDLDALRGTRVLFESDILLALEKPSGMSTGPLRPGERGTLLNAAIACAPQIAKAGPPLEGGLVHRLDQETSGVVLFAKDEKTRETLREAFSTRRIEKRYLALVADPERRLAKAFSLDGYIVQAGPRVRLVDAPSPGALQAVTDFSVVERLGHFALVEAVARTGRRHQIRVHLASLGTPIAGDPIYGAHALRPPWLDRLALHASRVELPDGKGIACPLADDLARVLGRLRVD